MLSMSCRYVTVKAPQGQRLKSLALVLALDPHVMGLKGSGLNSITVKDVNLTSQTGRGPASHKSFLYLLVTYYIIIILTCSAFNSTINQDNFILNSFSPHVAVISYFS